MRVRRDPAPISKNLDRSDGFQHALFEVAIDVLKRAKNLSEPASILEAIVATDYHSVVGPIKWSGKPVKNVSKTPLVAGQWRKRDTGFELVICEDSTAPNIKAQDTAQVEHTRRAIANERALWLGVLRELKLPHTDTYANFVFFDTGQPQPVLAAAMRERDIDIGRAHPPYTNWARITIGLPAENLRAQNALRASLKES